MTTQKLLVITGNQLSHKYFVNQLNSHFNLCVVFIEHFEYPDPLFKVMKKEPFGMSFFLTGKKLRNAYYVSTTVYPLKTIQKF